MEKQQEKMQSPIEGKYNGYIQKIKEEEEEVKRLEKICKYWKEARSKAEQEHLELTHEMHKINQAASSFEELVNYENSRSTVLMNEIQEVQKEINNIEAQKYRIRFIGNMEQIEFDANLERRKSLFGNSFEEEVNKNIDDLPGKLADLERETSIRETENLKPKIDKLMKENKILQDHVNTLREQKLQKIQEAKEKHKQLLLKEAALQDILKNM